MPLDIHQLEKLKMPTNQSAILYGQNAPKIFMFSVMFFKWEYQLLLLILMIGIVAYKSFQKL